MYNTWRLQLAAPVLCAVLIAGCGGSDGANDDRQAQQPQTNAPEQPGQSVALKGCVEPGPGTSQYVLRHVQFTGEAAPDPHRNTTTQAGGAITENSWVRLSADGKDLAKFAGQRVTMTGVVVDTGQDTIGTAGTQGVQTPSGDRSRAAEDEHYSSKVKEEAGRIGRESMSNGSSAEVRVSSIEGTGEHCEAEGTPGAGTKK
jgi:hypothetical protein